MFKQYIQRKLERLVKRYFQAHPEIKLITVVGSVGKTSTKNMIATILDQKYRIGGAMNDNNYNTEMSAPCGILGIKYPRNIRSIREWHRVFKAARARIKQAATVDLIVQELGVDKPGDMAMFGRYLRPDLTVLTAITPEHMENFGTMEAVAAEEIAAVNFSKAAFINRDDIDGSFARFISNPAITTYGASRVAENRIEVDDFSPAKGFSGRFVGLRAPEGFAIEVKAYGEQILRAVTAAIAVGLEFGMTVAEIQAALKQVVPSHGRMNLLKGLKNSLLLDDTYNSSPAAAREALRALYNFPDTSQRIAVLGSMNELGAVSMAAHQELGALCNPSLLEWVVTVGDEANRYLAPAARAQGCQVKTFNTALEAGGFVNKVLRPNSVVLFKGSQNKIYLEEAVKIVLASVEEQRFLVRQSEDWLKLKNDYFASFINLQEGDD